MKVNMALTLDIGEFPHGKSFGCIPTTIGELCVFTIAIGGIVALKKELGKPLKECEPVDFIKHFIRYICFPKSSLKDGVCPSKDSKLSNEQVSLLKEVDHEAIAEIYIKNNEYLFKKFSFKERKAVDGKLSYFKEFNEIKYARNENETFKQYLLRLLINEEEDKEKELEKALSSMIGANIFSKTLNEDIKKTLSFGESLKESLINPFPQYKEPFLPITHIYPENVLTKQDNTLIELSCKFDKLLDQSTRSNNFLVEANKIQTRIASEIKASGDETVKISKKGVNLTWLVIFLTGISIIAVVFSLWQSGIESKIHRTVNQKNVDSIIRELIITPAIKYKGFMRHMQPRDVRSIF